VNEFFPPELVNRLDSIQTFNKLSRPSILSIVSLRLRDVTDRLKDRRITIDVDQKAKEWLADRGYSHVYGARAIARIVQTKVLFPLARKMLSGTVRWASSLLTLFNLRVAQLTRCWRNRNGDVVSVRVTSDGTDLEVMDNHPPSDVSSSQSADLASTLAEEEPSV
jgi:ATP-dependent Clp protease ATP-binding subunit ClpB